MYHPSIKAELSAAFDSLHVLLKLGLVPVPRFSTKFIKLILKGNLKLITG